MFVTRIVIKVIGLEYFAENRSLDIVVQQKVQVKDV